MENILVILVIGIILFTAVFKVLRDRKNGVKCSGCPQSKICSTTVSECDAQPIKGSDIQLLKKTL